MDATARGRSTECLRAARAGLIALDPERESREPYDLARSLLRRVRAGLKRTRDDGTDVLPLLGPMVGARRALACWEFGVPRYFFHLISGTSQIVDRDGLEAADPGRLAAEAQEAVEQIQNEDIGIDLTGWTLKIVGESGREVLQITLGQLVS